MRSSLFLGAVLSVILLFCADSFASVINVNVRDIKTSSGVRYWFLEEKTFPVVSISVAFKNSGYLYDPNDKQGLAVLASSIILQGAVDSEGVSISKKLQNMGISMNFSADGENAYISLKTLSENLDDALVMLRQCLFNTSIDQKVFLTEKERQKSEVRRALNEPANLASETLKSLVFKDHPYANVSFGTLQTVDSISLQDVQSYIDNTFDLDKMVIGVVGNVDEEHLSEALDMTFANFKRGQNKNEVKNIAPALGLRGYVKYDSAQSVVVFSGNGISQDDPNYKVAQVLVNALGGTALSSVLMKELRENLGITYHVGSQLYTFGNYGVFSGILYTDGVTARKGIDALLKTIKEVSNNGLDNTSFEISKSDIVNSFIFSFLNSSSIAGVLREFQLLDMDVDYINNYTAEYESISKEDVDKFAKEFLSDLSIVEVGSKNNIDAEASV
ncbi:M16 family metallopeptidase [Anaplasma bovis]|uniref:M16 family metallopeptidase n=1 Tax=Anaplasma bovis TaxID=186733 RepID=UPI002FF40F94